MIASIIKPLAVAIGVGIASTAAIAAEKSPPDLTGLWTTGPAAPAPAGQPPAPARDAPVTAPANLLPGPKARFETFQKILGTSGATPGGSCLGTGMPGSMIGAGGYPMQIIQRPEQLTIIYELHTELRQIYLGDRRVKQQDRVPGRDGYSEGHWEGDTLVVDTDNLVEQLDQRNTPHSENAKIVERYHLNGTNAQGRRILVADWVMTDPDFYSHNPSRAPRPGWKYPTVTCCPTSAMKRSGVHVSTNWPKRPA